MSISKQTEKLQALAEQLRPLYDKLAGHSLYGAFETVKDLHVFMEVHVFAVWDFMSLLKTLQRGLTCIDVPWVPGRFALSRRLVNEIVLSEESDMYGTDAVSHFELYLRAMRECGASTTAIDALLDGLRGGTGWEQALAMSSAPAAAQQFVRATFAVIASNKLHATAAAFTFGREDLIPDMFRGFIRAQNERLHGRLDLMRWYMERHIEVDGEEHGPMALRMVAELCGNDATKWQEAANAAETALRARIALWDGIAEDMKMERVETLVS
jgi:Protein of unknown function (DUF3050)